MPFAYRSSSPRISLVIPVHRVQGYLRACLDSVIGQSYANFEVIAVDDCSPDSCAQILDEYAERDDRVRPIHLTVNQGAGRARDAGAQAARGDYLFFLDGDDTLAPGALAAVADRLATTGDPDVLLFGHVRTHWTNRVETGAASDLLAAAGTAVFTALERPEYLNVYAAVWNRVFRRAFFEDNAFAFAGGLYDDILLVWTTLLTAKTVACLDAVCVEYRQHRLVNAVRDPGRGHFRIFEQYDRLFAFLAERPHLDPVRPLVFERMTRHFLYTLGRPDRVPAELRAEYFKLAAARYKRLKPPGFTRPEGSPGGTGLALRLDLLERGSYTAYAAVGLAGLTRRRVNGRLLRARRTIGRQAYHRLYQLHLRRPIDPGLVVYSAYWHRGVACNPAAIHRKAQELAPHLRGVWIVRAGEEDRVPEGVDHVVARSPRYWEVMARAKYFVNNVNFGDGLVKRPGQVHLQTHHGTPLKQMGIDQQRFPAAAGATSFHRLLERTDRWDYSLSSNLHSTETWERVYPSAFESLDYGYPRNDVYFNATARDVARIRAGLGIGEGVTAILYAPTARDYQKDFVPRLDLERFTRELGPGHVVLVRAHYSYGADPRLRELQDRGLIKDVSGHPVVEELCLAADVLVTDYSSIMFDYACLDRPIVAYVDDWEVFSKARGVYFDLLSGRPGETPGAMATDEDSLVSVFHSGAWKGAKARQLLAAFRRRFVQFDDGNAAERVVRKLFLGEDATPPVLPLERRTPAPAPGAVHLPALPAALPPGGSGPKRS